MYYKKPLVISDNPHLCKKFKDIAVELNLDIFEFAISPFSNKDAFENCFEPVRIFDLKKGTDIDEIIGNYDLIISVHCKQIFPARLIKSVKCINVHPGYNPVNRGWYAQVFAIVHQLQVGATIHEMDEQLDHGKIIDRVLVKQEIFDTSLTLYNKIVDEEVTLLKKVLPQIIENNYISFEPESEGNLFLKKDFDNLKMIDLNEVTTAADFINKLRALTHGSFKNAYFVNPETGKKIFISINLEHE